MSRNVTILLATYNGAFHLPRQLDSLLDQSFDTWSLLIRDDVSNDETVDILESYRQRFPDKITILPPDGVRRGAAGSFATLMAAVKADYIMFCDQDDVWFSDKIERSLAVMSELEERYGKEEPLLVHTDLTVVAEDLTPLAPSLWRFQGSNPDGGAVLNRLLVQNTVTGCTVMINSLLHDLALPLPSGAVMHDWWLALTAAAFGRIGHVDGVTVLYRQHVSNAIGATGFTPEDVVRRIVNWREGVQVMEPLYVQAARFLERYRERMSPPQKELLTAFATMGKAGAFERRRRLLKYQFFYTGFIRNLGRLVLG